MVSTRHSIDANEKLISLDTIPRASTRSPSPRKRKLDQETPEQKFVDARATPFTQRKRTTNTSSRLNSSQDINLDGGYETADDNVTESNGSSRTLIASPQLLATADANESSVPIQAQQPADTSDHNTESDDDDEAPEVVSNTKGAEVAKASERAKAETLKRSAEEAKERRKKKNEQLREQKVKRNAAVTTIVEEQEQETEVESSKTPVRQVLPRLLPDEILNAPVVSSDGESPISQSQIQATATHKRFEPKKELTTVKKGPLTVQLLKKQRLDLAPKKIASTANTKRQWLYQRGKNAVDRRPIRKSLA